MLYHAAHYDCERPLGTYWEATGGPGPAGLEPLTGDTASEVAIVGGGDTGLSCAYHLARHGISAVVLEAGPIGWGASGRNGGFCGLGGTKLGYETMAQRFRLQAAPRHFAPPKGGARPGRAGGAPVRRALAGLGPGGAGGAPAGRARSARLPPGPALFRPTPAALRPRPRGGGGPRRGDRPPAHARAGLGADSLQPPA